MDTAALKSLVRLAATDPRTKAAARKAVTALQRKFRKSKFSKRLSKRAKDLMQVGEEPGTSTSLNVQNRSDGETLRNTHTQYGVNMLQIARLDTTFNIASRLRDVVFVSGFKVCLCVENLSATSGEDLYFNVAAVSNKGNEPANLVNDWFRSYDGTARSIDFTAATLTALDRHCQPINSDQYVVHFHKRVMIKQATSATATHHNEYAKKFFLEVWIPIKRQIRFDGGGASTSETKFNLVYWAGRMGDTITESQIPVTNAYSIEHKIIACFKDAVPKYSFPKY